MSLNIVAVTYNQNHELKCFVESILAQTNPDWHMFVIHDGPSPEFIKRMHQYWMVDRLHYWCTEERYNDWGHSLRSLAVPDLWDSLRYTVFTNCDNYYVPVFVEEMCSGDEDLVYCNIVHDHWKYQAKDTQLRRRAIDCGAVVVKTEIVKKIGWNHRNYAADWFFINDVLQANPSIRKVGKCLFVHN